MNDKIRILHILPSLECGGIETWLLHLMKSIDRNKYQFDFLIRFPKPCFYENSFKKLGATIYRVPAKVNGRKRPLRYLLGIRDVLKKGKYDIVHCHEGFNSGIYIVIAKSVGVPVRIAHAHNDYSRSLAQGSKINFLISKIKGALIKSYATRGLACSSQGAASLFGNDWQSDSRWMIFFCGLDFTPFQKEVDSKRIRKSLGIPSDAKVIGHVGRFVEQKNHKKIISIFKHVAKKRSDAYLLLVGDGVLQDDIKHYVEQLGLSERVVFAGVRSDVSDLMLGAMDVFLFPSRFEGLGLALVEAQAAGLPCVISDVIPKEADVVSKLVRRLPLSCSDDIWADKIIHFMQINKINKFDRRLFRNFDVTYSVNALADLYNREIAFLHNQLK